MVMNDKTIGKKISSSRCKPDPGRIARGILPPVCISVFMCVALLFYSSEDKSRGVTIGMIIIMTIIFFGMLMLVLGLRFLVECFVFNSNLRIAAKAALLVGYLFIPAVAAFIALLAFSVGWNQPASKHTLMFLSAMMIAAAYLYSEISLGIIMPLEEEDEDDF